MTPETTLGIERARELRATFDQSGVRRPNLFIVGAPKCGTTSLARSLAAHPSVYMSPRKEPLFFGVDLETARIKTSIEPSRYVEWFRCAHDEAVIGEASVWYLRSATAAQEINSFDPDARIIVMLRNPVDLLQSLHAQQIRSGNENLVDLSDALAAESARRQGKRMPSRIKYPGRLLYSDAVAFAQQVSRFLRQFGDDRVRVILLDDVATDSPGVMESLQGFVGLPGMKDMPLIHANQRRRVRSLALQSLALHPPRPLRIMARGIPSGARRGLGRAVSGTLGRLNLKAAHGPEMSTDLRRRLTVRFKDEIEELSALLDRDLSAWTEAMDEGVQ
jgi:Sulfotransferase domain